MKERATFSTYLAGAWCILLFSCAPALAAGRQATQAPSQQSTNLGTLVVAPENASPAGTLGSRPAKVQRSSLNLNIQLQPSGSAAEQTSSTGNNSAARGALPARHPPQPLHVVPPQYPPRAYAKGAQGSVTVEFVVEPSGRVTHVRILQAEPPGIFNDAARRAVRQWRFQPATENGRPVAASVSETLVFRPPASSQPKAGNQAAARRRLPTDHVPANIHPVHLVAPQYPPAAYRSGEGGQVMVQFTVLPDGHTANIRVLSAQPPGVFNLSAKEAVHRWRFRPVDKPTTVVQTIRFTPPSG